MIHYYTDADETVLIGVYSDDRSHATIAKIAGKLIEYDFVEADSDIFDEVGSFEQDTVIVEAAHFTEELLELIDKDIKVYLV